MSKLTPADAPTLVAAGVPEDKIEADLTPPAPTPPVLVEIPAHHIQCCYDSLKAGSSVDNAARVASVPREVASAIAKEVYGCAGKLGVPAPDGCKAEAERVEPKPVEDPKGEPGEGEVVP